MVRGEANAVRQIDRLLEEYGESHRNPTNKKIHWIAVPIIVWCVLALFWSLPKLAIFEDQIWLNWATLVLALATIYYAFLSVPLAMGMLLFSGLSIWVLLWIEVISPVPLWQLALGVFVLAWIAQFWGHKIEGKKPSFFKDVQFLLIGPAWLLHFIYRKFGIRY
jgi:uncharacterized membrane protein YGL010W